MEEIEVPLEKTQEDLHHHAAHSGDRWVSQIALSSALIAAMAAVAALLSGHHSNEAMLDQIQASDHWSYYQAKSIKANLLSTKMALVQGMKQEVSPKDEEKLKEYQKEQEEIAEKAKEKEAASHEHFARHQVLATSVTFFQVAIALSAIAALTRRRPFWFVSLGFGFIGVLALAKDVLAHLH